MYICQKGKQNQDKNNLFIHLDLHNDVSLNFFSLLLFYFSEPIVADDGSGSDISIPSFLMFELGPPANGAARAATPDVPISLPPRKRRSSVLFCCNATPRANAPSSPNQFLDKLRVLTKHDADKVKEQLKDGHPVQIEMAWSFPSPNDRVEYDLWCVALQKDSGEDEDILRMVADCIR